MTTKKQWSLTLAHGVAQWIVYPVCYYLIQYRKKVVRKNLCMAFPNKTKQEIKHLEKQFYHHFCNMIVEIILGRTYSQQDILQFITTHHIPEMEAQCKAHKGCFIMLGHFINWEWVSIVAVQLTQNKVDCGIVYKKLKNDFFDNLIKRLRERRGGFLIEMNKLLRIIVSRKNATPPTPTYYAMLADQRPRKHSKQHWTTFLGIETDVLTGTEQLAVKYQFPVYYAYIRIKENNQYDVTFMPIYIPQEEGKLPEGTITERFTRLLEQNVKEIPDRWLWTHNRFSHRKPQEDKYETKQ